MIDPTGPMPPRVYWRRRVVAVAMSMAAVVLLAWIIGTLVGSADEAPLESVSARAAQPPSSRPEPAPSSSASASATTSPPAKATKVPPAPPPPPPGPCPDAVIHVLAETGEPSYRLGQRPLLRLVVVNAGQLACVREVGRSLRELVVTSADGTTRVWSSNDCSPPSGDDSRLLQPGERLEFTVNWAGRTSAPGCPSRRRALPAGSYLVTAKLGALTSNPVPLELVG